MSMYPSTSQIEDGIAVTLALSAVRRYYFNIPGYSIWCAVGGLAAMEAIKLGSQLPQSVSDFFAAHLSVLGHPGQVAAIIVSGLSLEMAVQGSVELQDFTSVTGAQRIMIGAVAAFAGLYVADKVKKYMKNQ